MLMIKVLLLLSWCSLLMALMRILTEEAWRTPTILVEYTHRSNGRERWRRGIGAILTKYFSHRKLTHRDQKFRDMSQLEKGGCLLVKRVGIQVLLHSTCHLDWQPVLTPVYTNDPMYVGCGQTNLLFEVLEDCQS